MTRTMTALAATLAILVTSPAPAEPLAPKGGAADTGVPAPSVVGGVPAGTVGRSETIDDRAPNASSGNAASRSNSSVPGTTPDVNIGGTPTSGPPGTGGAAGGPSLGGQ